MSGLATKARTALALGPANILRVGLYRAGLKLGVHPAQRLEPGNVATGSFLAASSLAPLELAGAPSWTSGHKIFGHLELPASEAPPDWHVSLANGRRADAQHAWWRIPDFDAALGDIKPVWELSRMAWLLSFAQQARNGNAQALELANRWLADWFQRNPPYRGVNWKCGQEASLRVLNLAMAAHILGDIRSPSPTLRDLIALHLTRVAPTLSYARAQDNNHGTSEAAALFIGGAMLGRNGRTWRDAGRAALEERVARLVMPDGSFSQQSLVYHRLLLDTLSLAEVARRAFDEAPFSALFTSRAKAATGWMRAMIDVASGDGPNLGANDGAHLLDLTGLPNRDFRPSLQLAAALFAGARAMAHPGPWDETLAWLGVAVPSALLPPPRSQIAGDGGFAMLRNGAAMALLRYPRFRFRPSQADVMHVDLWVDGENLLGDAGTYSYNTDAALMAYFNGTASHNTIQFDGRNQMPQLGRFLFGDWLTTESAGPLEETPEAVSFTASYSDRQGAHHRRSLTLAAGTMQVEDYVTGVAEKAVLRWRLRPGSWTLDFKDGACSVSQDRAGSRFVLSVASTAAITRAEIVEGQASLRYLEKLPVPVLEVEVNSSGRFTTKASWTA